MKDIRYKEYIRMSPLCKTAVPMVTESRSEVAWAWSVRRPGGWAGRGVMEMLHTLIVVVITWVYTRQTLHSSELNDLWNL